MNAPKAEATEPSELHHELMIKDEIKSEDIDEDYTLTSQNHPKKVIESVERESEDTEISALSCDICQEKLVDFDEFEYHMENKHELVMA